MWETISANIKDFFNQPVPIIGSTIGALLIFVLSVISKTSIGKKALNELKNKYNKLTTEFLTILESFKKHKEKIDETLKVQKEALEIALKEKQEEIDKLEELIIAISENIHNAKVKELVDTYIKEKKPDEQE